MKAKLLIAMLSLLMPMMTYAQNITVHGTVVSKNDNEPLTGATIISETDRNTGTTADLDGNFTLTVASGSRLIISYIGFNSITTEAQETMHIALEEDSRSLDDVVVVGYSTQKKADLTGAISVVSTKDLETSPDTDPMRALQGKVPGMTITANGSPSGTGTVRIRGIGSFNASQDPLFVIDGVPTTASLNSLNMNDIESMQVLKDAASASIYGSRAANSVIIITTKSGKKAGKDKVQIDFSTNLLHSTNILRRRKMCSMTDKRMLNITVMPTTLRARTSSTPFLTISSTTFRDCMYRTKGINSEVIQI